MQYWQRRRKRNEKDRQKLRMHLVCQAKCKYTCVIRFKDGKMGNQNARRLDAVQTEKIGLYCVFLYDLWRYGAAGIRFSGRPQLAAEAGIQASAMRNKVWKITIP